MATQLFKGLLKSIEELNGKVSSADPASVKKMITSWKVIVSGSTGKDKTANERRLKGQQDLLKLCGEGAADKVEKQRKAYLVLFNLYVEEGHKINSDYGNIEDILAAQKMKEVEAKAAKDKKWANTKAARKETKEKKEGK